MTDMRTVPVTHLDPNPANPRSSIEGLDELVESIKAQGIIEPLIVRPNGAEGTYQVVAGHRRLAAALRAGLSDVPVVVREDLDDAAVVAIALVENLHRSDIDPVDEAAGYAQLKGFGWKQKDIADALGRSQAHVSKRLRLLDLSEDVLEQVRYGDLTVELAYEVAAASKKHGFDADSVAAELVTQHHPTLRAAALDQVVDSHKWQKAADEFAAQLEADGYQRLAGEWEFGHQRGPFKPTVAGVAPAPIDHWDSPGAQRLDVDADAHRSEPCARFHVGQGFDRSKPGRPEPVMKARWWCVDPNRHTTKGDSDIKITDANQKRLREEEKNKQEEKDRRAARRQRAAFIDRLFSDVAIAAGVDYDRVVERAFGVLTERIEANTAKRACKYLNLEPVETRHVDPDVSVEWSTKDYRATLATALSQDLYRTLLAITLAHGENMEQASYLPEGSTAVTEHHEYMASLGYEPPAELPT